jgi:hypothetical protein
MQARVYYLCMNPQSLVLNHGGGLSRRILMFLFMSMAAAPVIAANEGQTNRADLYYASPYLEFPVTTESDTTLQKLFREITDSDDMVFDRLSTAGARLDWLRQQDEFGYRSLQNLNSEGARLFGRIGLDSLREVVAGALPLEMWQDQWEGWFGNFLAGTIGNPEEEHLRYTSVSYSAVRTTWERGNDDAGIQWGIRPWRTSPYVYVLAKAGHYEGRSLIMAEGRAGYTMLGSSKVEGRLTLALPANFQIAAGASFDPARVNSGDATHFAAMLERIIGSQSLQQTTLFFVGFRSGYRYGSDNQRGENAFIVGFSRGW